MYHARKPKLGGRNLRVLSFFLASLMLISFHALPQADSFAKNFKLFKEVAPGIDFFCSSRSDVVPYEKALQESDAKLRAFLGKDLAKGAIVICTTMEQKDTVTEARLLKMGYRWALIQLTPEATAQQMVAQIKAQMGGQVPPGLLERFQNQSPEMKASQVTRLVNSTLQRAAYAIVTTTLNPEKEFRPSRLDDVGRSPLADWLDIGLICHSVGPSSYNLRFLQDRMEEAFPLEDILSMSRPFVAPSSGSGSGGGGGGMTMLRLEGGGGGASGSTGGGAMPGGGAPQQVIVGGTGSGGNRDGGGGGRGGMNMPKDVQDRTAFDAQAATFFSFILQKLGMEKTKALIQSNLAKKETLEILSAADMLGPDMEKIEKDWQSWVKEQKAASPDMMRIQLNPARTPDRQ